MTALPDRCVPCRGGVAPLDAESAEALRREHVPDWSLDGARLRREFRLRDFRRALAWVNRVGMLAEEEQHHPDIHITGWNRVGLELWTHAIDGLHTNDYVLASKIDALWERFDPE